MKIDNSFYMPSTEGSRKQQLEGPTAIILLNEIERQAKSAIAPTPMAGTPTAPTLRQSNMPQRAG